MLTSTRRLAVAASLAATAFLAAPASAAVTATPANDPCTATYVQGAIACQGYYGGNLLSNIGVGDAINSTTNSEIYNIINLLLTGTPSTSDDKPTSNTSAYTGNYASVDFSKVLAYGDNYQSGPITFSPFVMNGLTVIGAHFGNNTDSIYNTVTAFWLVNITSPTSAITLLDANGNVTTKGTSNAAVFATQSAVPEPATWALMLLGFGGMGVAMRRRRSQSALPQVA